MSSPAALFTLRCMTLTPPSLSEVTLILIDYQNEYLDGPLKLVGAAGSLFDRAAHRGAIVDVLASDVAVLVG